MSDDFDETERHRSARITEAEADALGEHLSDGELLTDGIGGGPWTKGWS